MGDTKRMINMTEGSPYKVLIAFAVPMILSNLLQQLYNVVDTLIVGRYLGTGALTAVGSVGSISAVLVQLASGLAMGGSIVISQYFGAERFKEIQEGSRTLTILSAGIGLLCMLFTLAFSVQILGWVQTPEEIFYDSAVYLNWYLIGTLPLFIYNAFQGIYVALGDSKTPLYFLMVSTILNMILDYMLIVIIPLGTAGAAIATTLAQFVTMILAFFHLPKLLRQLQSQEKPALFKKEMFWRILKFALPTALQQSVVSVGSVIVQSVINGFGPAVIAGSAAATKIVNIASSVSINFGNALSNYVGQNIGAGKQDRISKGLQAALLISGLISIFMTVLLEIFRKEIIQLFLKDESAQEVLNVGMEYIHVVGMSLLIFSCYMLLKAIFKGVGDMGWFIFCTLLSFFIRLFLTIGFAKTYGPSMIWWSISLGWSLGLIVSFLHYKGGKWKKKSILLKKL